MVRRGALLLVVAAVRRSASSEVSEAPQPPEDMDLRLRLLQVVVRHGERTPIAPMRDRAFWEALLPSQSLLDSLEEGTLPIWSAPTHLNELEGAEECPPEVHPSFGDGIVSGRLTAEGIEQMEELGASLRAALVNGAPATQPLFAKLVSRWEGLAKRIRTSYGGDGDGDGDGDGGATGFVPAEFDPGAVRVWSTDFPRTIRSAQALLRGLYPLGKRTTYSEIAIDTRGSESLIPDPVPRSTEEQLELELELRNSDPMATLEQSLGPDRLRLSNALVPLLGEAALAKSGAETAGAEKTAGAEILGWSTIADTLSLLNLHGKLPSGVSAADVAIAEGARVNRTRILTSNRHYIQLAMGTWVAQICSQWQASVEAGHDARAVDEVPDEELEDGEDPPGHGLWIPDDGEQRPPKPRPKKKKVGEMGADEVEAKRLRKKSADPNLGNPDMDGAPGGRRLDARVAPSAPRAHLAASAAAAAGVAPRRGLQLHHGGDAAEQRLLIYSAHDSSIEGLIGAFRLHAAPGSWPNFGACLLIELLEDVKTFKSYVRFSLDGVVLRTSLLAGPTGDARSAASGKLPGTELLPFVDAMWEMKMRRWS